jgi:hypothetical protein
MNDEKGLERRVSDKESAELEEKLFGARSPGKLAPNAEKVASGDGPAKKWKRGDRVIYLGEEPEPMLHAGMIYTVIGGVFVLDELHVVLKDLDDVFPARLFDDAATISEMKTGRSA